MDKKRIAILFGGNIYRVRGEFTAIHNRIKELKKNEEFIVDAYVFCTYFDKFTSFIKRTKSQEMKHLFKLEGITYNCIWYRRSHIDNITHKLFKRRSAVEINKVIKTAERFKEYDIIYANSLYTAHIGLKLKQKYGKPFVCMWHGSSIHTAPFGDRNVFKRTKYILENADMNLFVSDELLNTAKLIARKFKGEISYNGIDIEKFYRLPNIKRDELRQKKGIRKEDKCIAFVGNCMGIKNVQYLPILFTTIKDHIPGARFFIIGSGAFPQLFADYNLNITYTNNVNNIDMPNWYRVMDLVVMPSINEGLPMTCLEATACGTPFVGSRVGAIAKVVGIENTIERNEYFNEKFAQLCVKKLKENETKVTLPKEFVLSNIVSNETDMLESLINK